MEYDQHFIQPEIRCDWQVTEKMKKIWWIQLDLIKTLSEICSKNGLRWYPMWGTLLGAVRHQGFIPWDDDVDIVMPRDDYEKLLEVCKTELQEPYFLQTTLTDNECFYMWASIRNSETTGNRESCLSKDQNNGIGIDIMPLDGCEDSPILYKITRMPVRVVSVLANNYVNEFNNDRKHIIVRQILRGMKFNYKKAYIWCENRNRRFKIEKYNRMTYRAHADPLTKVIQRGMWLKDDFKETIMMPFEMISIPVPCGYDRILTQIYGNYMEFPPLEKRAGKHDVVFEPDIPYREFCTKGY